MSPSDRVATLHAKPELRLSSRSSLDYLRPQPPIEAALSSQEASVAESKFGGVGRPSNDEIERQRSEFRALVKAGVPWVDAARQAGCKPERALAEAEAIARSLLSKAA